MPPVKDVGERLEGEPHEPFDGGTEEPCERKEDLHQRWVSGPTCKCLWAQVCSSTDVCGAPPSYPTVTIVAVHLATAFLFIGSPVAMETPSYPFP
jgi:hypothetical protein